MPALEQIPTGNGKGKEGPQDKGSQPHMNEPIDGRRVEHHGPKVGDLSPDSTVLLYQVITGGGLHKTVGYHDPDGAEKTTQTHHAGGEIVKLRRDFIPTEYHHSQKPGL